MEAGNSILNQTKLTTPENKDGFGSGVRKSVNKADVTIRLTLVILTIITIYTFLSMDYSNVNLSKAIMDTLSNFKLMFFQPYSHHLTVWDAFYGVFLTLGMAFLTTLIGAVLAIPLGLMAAQNLAPKWLTNMIKGFVALIRAIPTILWVLIFAVSAGLGSTAAVIGLTFHTVSYLTKAYAESFEDLDRGTIEALQASGADFWQIVFQAVMPCSATYLLSWTFLRFEINFGNAVAMGAAAGAAGVGFDLYMASGFYFDLHEVGLITYFILAIAIFLEALSTKMKSRVRKGV